MQMHDPVTNYCQYPYVKGQFGVAFVVETLMGPLKEMRVITTQPFGVGFGIKDGHTAQAVRAIADAMVVGSVLVKQIVRALDQLQAIKNGIANSLNEMRMMMDAKKRSVA